MKEVYLIEEENHGIIGVAKDYPSVIDFLIDSNWLDENFEVWVNDGEYLTQTIKEQLGEDWVAIMKNDWSIEQFSNYFDGCFYLTTEEVYGT